MREFSEEEKYLARQKIEELIERRYIDKVKNPQEHFEAGFYLAFTSFRICITTTICLIFLIIDFKILAFTTTISLTLTFTPEKLTIIKYGFLFLASQLVIFSQGFGFSSIVKLMERFSSKKNAKEAEKVEN